jgi:hypothetical protein
MHQYFSHNKQIMTCLYLKLKKLILNMHSHSHCFYLSCSPKWGWLQNLGTVMDEAEGLHEGLRVKVSWSLTSESHVVDHMLP